MAKERQKWTLEEEEALYAGVDKHGPGKWKVILLDPEFASALSNRSNIDLKDKWRNVSVNREKVRTPSFKEVEEEVSNMTNNTTNPQPLNSLIPSSVVPLIDYGGTPASSRIPVDRRTAPDYEAMIFEALLTIGDRNGVEFHAILRFLKNKFELPEFYKRSVASKLRTLVVSGELEKVENRFRIFRGTFSGAESLQKEDEKPREEDNNNNNNNKKKKKKKKNDDDEATDMSESPLPRETIEDASMYAAHALARAENAEQKAIESCAEADRFAALVEESLAMVHLAEEIHERCLRDGYAFLAP